MTPQQILLDAADRIEKEGWGQRGEVMYGQPRLCPVTAINPYGAQFVTERDAAVKLLRHHLGVSSIVTWNDGYGRTKAEVLAAMRAAAAGSLPSTQGPKHEHIWVGAGNVGTYCLGCNIRKDAVESAPK